MDELWVDTPYAEEISNHVEKWLGPVEYVLHEIISDVVHIDILVVKPGASRPCYTLVTSGMSAKRMTVPEGREDWALAELIITLPASNAYLASEERQSETDIGMDEKLDFEASEPPGYYPVRQLKQFARYPHLADSWIGPGHTLVTADPPEPLGEDTKMTGYLVELPYAIKSSVGFYLQTKEEVRVNFLQMYAIHTDELEFKLKYGADALMKKLIDDDSPATLAWYDPVRPSVLRKKFFGLF